MSQALGLVLQMLTTVCSKHRAVWPADSNDRDRDYNGSNDKAQIPINDSLRAISHLTLSRPVCLRQVFIHCGTNQLLSI